MSVRFYEYGPDDNTPTINSLGSDSDHAAANLSDRNRNFYWKAGNANTSGSIDIDLGESPSAIKGVALVDHNYSNTSVGIKVAYDAGGDGNYGSLTYMVGDAGSYHDYTSDDSGIWTEHFSSTGARYWRVYLEAQGAGNYQQIGFICFSTLLHPVNYTYGGQYGLVPGVEVGETDGGVRRRQKNHNGRKMFQLTWNNITQSHYEDILDFWQHVHGNFYPFVYEDENDNAYYVTLEGISYTPRQYQLWDMTLKLEEDI